jgi:predicted GIY-YIG superfamily endonuclease
MSNLILREFKGKKIRQRKDGFMSLTDMCDANGKMFADWNRQKATKEYLKVLRRRSYVNSHNGPVEVNVGGSPETTGAWGDRRVAMRLAQWLSPEFAIQVDEWVVEFLAIKTDQETFEKSFFFSLYETNHKKQSAYVYALHDQANGRVKIGFTQNPAQRLKQLQLGDSATFAEFYGVRHVATKGEAQIHEKYLHEIFRKDLISGEWFNDDLMVDARFENYFFPCGDGEFIFGDSIAAKEVV